MTVTVEKLLSPAKRGNANAKYFAGLFKNFNEADLTWGFVVYGQMQSFRREDEISRFLLRFAEPQDKNRLRQFLVESAEQALPVAKETLAFCYEEGILFQKNPILAGHLRQMLHKVGHSGKKAMPESK